MWSRLQAELTSALIGAYALPQALRAMFRVKNQYDVHMAEGLRMCQEGFCRFQCSMMFNVQWIQSSPGAANR